MNHETRQAMEASIQHWERMRGMSLEELRQERETPFGPYCALCQRFCRSEPDCIIDRELCPVALWKMQQGIYPPYGCHDTPWVNASRVWSQLCWREPMGADAELLAAWREAASREIAFLESLREEENTKGNSKE